MGDLKGGNSQAEEERACSRQSVSAEVGRGDWPFE